MIFVFIGKDNQLVSDIAPILLLDTNIVTPLLRMEKTGVPTHTRRQRIAPLTRKEKAMLKQAKQIPIVLLTMWL